MGWLNKNQDLMDGQFSEFDKQLSEEVPKQRDWKNWTPNFDDKKYMEVHDYSEKINKKIHDVPGMEVPYMMSQRVYDFNNEDVDKSKKMLKEINDTLEAQPEFDEYRGGDYTEYWDDEFHKIEKMTEANKDIFGADINSKESMEGFISRINQLSESDLTDLSNYFKYPKGRSEKALEEHEYMSSNIWNEINKRRESEGLPPMPT
jgi:hypothetical protein|tara:strand:+ start:308 stop:919 length:612 start_codon:yes stop_codon:yes gene_type:complete